MHIYTTKILFGFLFLLFLSYFPYYTVYTPILLRNFAFFGPNLVSFIISCISTLLKYYFGLLFSLFLKLFSLLYCLHIYCLEFHLFWSQFGEFHHLLHIYTTKILFDLLFSLFYIAIFLIYTVYTYYYPGFSLFLVPIW